MCEMKKRSSSLRRLFQSWRSLDRSISSAVQKDASAFLYICQICRGRAALAGAAQPNKGCRFTPQQQRQQQ